jgi:hypothetical protein
MKTTKWMGMLLCAALVFAGRSDAQKKVAAPKTAPKPAVKAPAPASRAASGARPGGAAGARPGGAAGRPGTANTAGRAGAGRAEGGRAEGGRAGVTHEAGGRSTVRTADHREFNRGPNGRVESFHGAHGEEAHFGRDGHVRDIRSGNMHIQRGPGGARRVEMERGDHSRLVMNGRGRGYISRPYSYHGRAYSQRDYYMNGRRYSNYYHPYYYNGVYLHGYVPGVYYAPAYYGWAYTPWPQPVPYAWGWGAAPWYGAYNVYFAPYPVYSAPSLWLTDYIISQQLQAAYQAGAAAGAAGVAMAAPATGRPHLVYAAYFPPPPPSTVALTPAVKQAINDEVQAYLTAEATAAKASGDDQGSGLDKLLADGKPHVFVASEALTVSPTSGDCGLTQGDVVQATGAPAANADTLNVTVLAGKSGDCAMNSAVPVKLEDLQEMQNAMMASVDQGLAQIKEHPGQGGMPAPPAADLASQTAAPYTADAPPADPNVGQELQQADQQAQQTEQQVLAQATPPPDADGAEAPAPAATAAAAAPSPQATPVTIALGQTTTDVALNRGRPKQIVNLGPKTIWVYDDMKIIFVNGKVSDVQ